MHQSGLTESLHSAAYTSCTFDVGAARSVNDRPDAVVSAKAQDKLSEQAHCPLRSIVLCEEGGCHGGSDAREPAGFDR